MKKHGFRSIFSLLLAVMMVCSMLPTAAFAEGDAEEQPVVVETYTVTYADGMGGAAFPEQKKDGLLYGDPTPAFEGELALEGYTFTGWEPALAETVTESVTYTAQWQEVQQEVDGNGETDMQKGPDGQPPLNPDGGYGGPSHWNPDVGDAMTWGHDTESNYVVYNVEPRAAGTITITVKVFDGQQEYTVGSDTAKKANKGVQSEAYVIPELTKFVEAGKFGKVTGVHGNWYWPGTINRAVGTTIYWSNNSSTGTMIYYVDWYNPNGGGDNPTNYLWNFTLHYDANGGTGAPADQFYGTNSKYEKSYDFIISGTEPTREGYTFKGWSDTKDGSVTYQKGGKCHVMQTATGYNGGSVTKTLYAVWEKKAPNGPTLGEVTNLLGQVTVHCTTPIAGHEDQTYGLNYILSYMVMAPDGSGYTCDVRVEADEYVTKYNKKDYPGTDHVLADGEKRIRSFVLRNDNDGKGWYISEGENLLPIVFNVKCKAPTPPSVPTDQEIEDALRGKVYVVVSCVTENSGHPLMKYPLFAYVSGLTKPNPNEVTANSDGTYSYTVSFLASNFVKMYSMAAPNGIGSDHELADVQDLRTVTLTWKDSTIGWTATTQNINVSARCKTENPPVDIRKPTFDELKDLLEVKVECTNESAVHESKFEWYALKNVDEDPKFAIGEVDQSGDAPTCTVTIGSKPYVAAFDSTTGKAHEPADTTKRVDLVYNKGTGKWALQNTDDATVVFQVACTTEEPEVPGVITDEDLKKLSVVINCTNEAAAHEDKSKSYALDKATCGLNHTEEGYACEITVPAAPYVNKYTSDTKTNHELVNPAESSKTITLRWNTETKAWAADPNSVTFDVKCETAPVIPELDLSMLQVIIDCDKDEHQDESFDLLTSTYTKTPGQTANSYIIEISADGYVDKYNDLVAPGHQLVDPATSPKTITATWDGVKWDFDAPSVTFYVKCETQSEVPGDITDEDLAKLKVVIHCTNGSHTDRTYDLIPETYRPDYSDGGFTCNITVPAAPYVNKYISDTTTNHELVDPQERSKTFTLRWNTETEAWAADSNSVTFDVKCGNVPAQKYTVTYTDGVDGVEIFKDQVYADLTAGTATPKFNGTPTRVGYVFAGWNPAVAATVTGNATYTASWKVDSNNNGKPDDEEERYTVTYLDGANGKAFASQVYPGLLSGTATPKFNGTPVRSGYVFIGWSPVWSGTVTGNVTYTATWSTITGGLDKVPKTGDSGLTLALSALLLFSFCGAACVVSTKKRG